MIDFDFHIHSAPHSGCASQTVKQAVEKAYSAGIRTIALCDHNCIDGLEEAKAECDRLGMTFVNGVELSVSVCGVSDSLDGTVIHVLGYNINPDKVLFASLKEPFDREVQSRFNAIIEYLQSLGYKISDGVSTSKELRKELHTNGYFADEKEAKRFLKSPEILSRFPLKKIPIDCIVDIIHALGGLAVLAHPNSGEDHAHLQIYQTNQIIEFLAQKGLDGLEVFHSDTVSESGVVDNLLEQAKLYNLKITLGSDRHHCDDRYGNDYFSMADKLKTIDYGFDTIRTFWKD